MPDHAKKAFSGEIPCCQELWGHPTHQEGLHIRCGSDLRAEYLKGRPNRVDDLTKSAFLNRPDLHVETSGEFAGWRTWSRDNFETHNGPFYHRMEDDGRIHCAFRIEKKRSEEHTSELQSHLNLVCRLLLEKKKE